MQLKLGLIYITLLAIFFSCKKNISFQGFDDQKWRSDKGGCSGIRESLTKKFIEVKNQLKGLPSVEIREFLGKPDKEDLYSRNQKFYYYYVKPGIHCSNSSDVSKAERITVRFSAMDRVTEINYAEGD